MTRPLFTDPGMVAPGQAIGGRMPGSALAAALSGQRQPFSLQAPSMGGGSFGSMANLLKPDPTQAPSGTIIDPNTGMGNGVSAGAGMSPAQLGQQALSLGPMGTITQMPPAPSLLDRLRGIFGNGPTQ